MPYRAGGGRLTDFVCTPKARVRAAVSANGLDLIRHQVVRRMAAHAAPPLGLVPFGPPSQAEAGSTPRALWRPLLDLRPGRLPLKVERARVTHGGLREQSAPPDFPLTGEN